jgi:hypothetical protein
MNKVAYTKEYDLIVRVIHLSKKQEFQQATEYAGNRFNEWRKGIFYYPKRIKSALESNFVDINYLH